MEYDSYVSAVDLSFAMPSHSSYITDQTVRMEKQEMNLGDGKKNKRARHKSR